MSYKNNQKNIVFNDSKKLLICKDEYFTTGMQALLANPDIYLEKTDGPLFKSISGDTTTVGVITLDNKKFVIKRYNLKGFWHSLKKMLRQSRALRSWKNSHYLLQHNIPTPAPIAILITYNRFLRGKTYFITEYVDGVQGRDLFAEINKANANWEPVLQNIGKLLEKLYSARITHDDFQHRNMIFVNNIPFLLDLDHMRMHKYNSFWFRHNFRKDVKHFLKLLEINPEAFTLAKKIFKQLFSLI